MKNKNLNPFRTSRLVFEKAEGPSPENIRHTSVLEDLDAAYESDEEIANKQLTEKIQDQAAKIATMEKRLDAMQASQQPKATNAPTTQASTDQSWFDKARGKIPKPATSVAQPAATPAKAPAGKPKDAASAGGPGDTGPTAPPKAGAEPQKESAERTSEQKFQLMMDKYVGDKKLISAKDFAGALNYADDSGAWNATDVSNKDNASHIVEAVKELQKKLNTEKNAGLVVDGIFGRKTNAAYNDKKSDAPSEPAAAAEAPAAPASPATVPPEATAPTPAAVPGVAPPPAEAVPSLSIFDKFNKEENFYRLTFSAVGIEGPAAVNQYAATKAGMKEGEIVYLEKGTVESGKHKTVTIVDSKGNSRELDSSNLEKIISPADSAIQRRINQYKIARFRESHLGGKFARLDKIKIGDIKKLDGEGLVYIVQNKELNQADVANLLDGESQSVDKDRLTDAGENEIFSALVNAYGTQKVLQPIN